MKTLIITISFTIFSVIIWTELGWMTFIVLPLLVFFIAASVIPMMITDDVPNNRNLPTYQ